ncbi:MAG: hypothetical protein ACREUZ_10055 [Burkholderiales bacterium]
MLLCRRANRAVVLGDLAVVAVLVAWPVPGASAPAFSSAYARTQKAADFSTLSAAADAARVANRLNEAAPLYYKALELRPDWKEGWWALGTILYEQDSHGAASASARVERLPVQITPGLDGGRIMRILPLP